MARIVAPLTATKIQNAKPKEKLYKLTDGQGLALWVYPSGKKTWRFEYRRADKKLDTITFGSYPSLSLAEARAMREKNRALLEKNIDPKIASQGDEVITLKSVFDLWYERWYETVSNGYSLQMTRALENNIFPVLGHIDIASIKPKDVVGVLSVMEDRGSLEYLRRTKQILGQVFDFAVARGICDFNPVASIGSKAFKKPVNTNYSAIKPSQLPDLLNGINGSNMNFITKQCILWMMATLVRPSEATNMPWDELNFDSALWVIPPERMKAGREHVVPVSTFAMEIAKRMYEITGNGKFVFVGLDFRSPLNRETPRIALRRLKTKGIDTTSHGLRALGRTYLEESGLWRTEVMESALAHVQKDKTVAAYNRAEYIEEKREMLEWWGEEIRKFIHA